MVVTKRWEVILPDVDEDASWEMDQNQVRRVYVGPVLIEEKDPEGRILESHLYCMRLHMPYGPQCFQTPPLEVEHPIETDPDEPPEDYTPATPVVSDSEESFVDYPLATPPADAGSSTHPPETTQGKEDDDPMV